MRLPMLRKYFIMGSQDCDPSQSPIRILESAIAGGITAFQFREKGQGSLTGKAKLELGKQLRETCHQHNIPFIINDDINMAISLDVDGIHVGQDDVPVSEVRNLFPKLVIGLSVSSERELANSPLSIVDYIGAGPIFATSTKADAKEAVGVAWIKELRKAYPNLPIVGIGGINTYNAAEVIMAGADGVSVISVITKSQNIRNVVKAL